MATIKDVAALAGVSVSTVSYALNGTRSISALKKARISEAMQELHYHPRAIARSLASKRTHIIAILFPFVDHGIGLPEIDLILRAAESALGHGYHLVIWTLQSDTEEELQHLLRQELVDGVILMEVHTNDRRIAVFKHAGIPFVLLGRDETAPDETFMDIDFFATMMQCISYLKTLGHRKLIFINQSEKSFRSGYGPVIRTHKAFSYFCDNFDMEGQAFFCNSDAAAAVSLTETLLSTHPGVTAYIAMNDRALPGILAGITRQNLHVPADISVVSIISSASAASFLFPAVTTYEMDIQTLMGRTVMQLIAKVEGRYIELQDRLIPCVLHERNTTAAARSNG
jgi:DNA-binding LacI/PurR family transcriptional regulator